MASIIGIKRALRERATALPLIVLAWLALIVLALWVLSHFTRTILLVVLAAVLAFAFTPLANLFARRMPRSVAIGLAYLLGLSLVFGFGAYVVATAFAQVGALITSLPSYYQQAQILQPQVEALLAPLGDMELETRRWLPATRAGNSFPWTMQWSFEPRIRARHEIPGHRSLLSTRKRRLAR